MLLNNPNDHSDLARIAQFRKAQTQDLEDAFVNVSFSDREQGLDVKEGESGMYKKWIENGSAKYPNQMLFGADTLRKLYPKHSLVMTRDFSLNILNFPGAVSVPLNSDELLTNVYFAPQVRSSGVLVDSVEFGCFRTAWGDYEFTIYIVTWPITFGTMIENYILHEGPEQPIREMLRVAGTYAYALHQEIWVFENGFWRKNHALWTEIQKANWKDVILKQSFKDIIQKDVYSFFDSEDLYKRLAIPWKRGIIMFGPPGNGKTISLKAIMKDVYDRGFSPLYVKSFVSWRGEEGSMAEVFGRARELAPCVIILEDLDSLINDRNRSFFLNQLDGIEGNDGLLVIGTTNHFDRLDPGLSERPSRFDRKYNFEDPDRDERVLYIKYWQSKLSDNDEVDFPEALVTEVADLTGGFSFAYLKEAFVSSLVLFLQSDGDDGFETILKNQIKTLRKQLDKGTSISRWVGMNKPSILASNVTRFDSSAAAPLPPKPDMREVSRTSMLRTVPVDLGSEKIFMY